MTKIIGIDYSLTCPCCCIFESEDLSYENAKFYYLTSTKKYEGVFLDGKVIGDRIEDYTNQQERHDNISNWVFKRAVGNSGLNVPLIIRYPDKKNAGKIKHSRGRL